MSPTLALRRLIADAGHNGVVTVAAVTAALAESDAVMLNILACARMVAPENALFAAHHRRHGRVDAHADCRSLPARDCQCINCKAIAAAVNYMLDAKAAAKP